MSHSRLVASHRFGTLERTRALGSVVPATVNVTFLLLQQHPLALCGIDRVTRNTAGGSACHVYILSSMSSLQAAAHSAPHSGYVVVNFTCRTSACARNAGKRSFHILRTCRRLSPPTCHRPNMH